MCYQVVEASCTMYHEQCHLNMIKNSGIVSISDMHAKCEIHYTDVIALYCDFSAASPEIIEPNVFFKPETRRNRYNF